MLSAYASITYRQGMTYNHNIYVVHLQSLSHLMVVMQGQRQTSTMLREWATWKGSGIWSRTRRSM